ncbi:MAG: AAA+ ATPase superfamily predicted ATPase [Phenylobacterium sp.]|jgi:AAA+ ATPase superfamily predicted ATPase
MTTKLIHNPQFMFRDAELERILTQLRQNKSVLLTGLRRTGKTQVVKEALFRFQQSGGEAHYLDVQDYVSLHLIRKWWRASRGIA